MIRLMVGLGTMLGAGLAYATYEQDGMALLSIIGFGLTLWGLDAVEQNR